jgi:hypothetical protein
MRLDAVVDEIHALTPDGRPLRVHRSGDLWIVRCGSTEALARKLAVAMTEAMGTDPDVVAHTRDGSDFDYAAWVRLAAEEIEDVFSAVDAIA